MQPWAVMKRSEVLTRRRAGSKRWSRHLIKIDVLDILELDAAVVGAMQIKQCLLELFPIVHPKRELERPPCFQNSATDSRDTHKEFGVKIRPLGHR